MGIVACRCCSSRFIGRGRYRVVGKMDEVEDEVLEVAQLMVEMIEAVVDGDGRFEGLGCR